MVTGASQISILQAIEKRAHARPCTFSDLQGLEREWKESIQALRMERETRRQREVIEAESPELRKAMEVARCTIRRAMAEHGSARREISRLEEMVRRGHVHEAVKEHAKLQTSGIFTDLNCDFVGAAVEQQQTREQRLVAVVVVAAGIILVVVVLIELMKRSTPNSP